MFKMTSMIKKITSIKSIQSIKCVVEVFLVRDETNNVLRTRTSSEMFTEMKFVNDGVPFVSICLANIGTGVDTIFKRGDLVVGCIRVIVGSTEPNIFEMKFRIRPLHAVFGGTLWIEDEGVRCCYLVMEIISVQQFPLIYDCQ